MADSLWIRICNCSFVHGHLDDQCAEHMDVANIIHIIGVENIVGIRRQPTPTQRLRNVF